MTGDHAGGVALPVVAQPRSKVVGRLDELLLLFDPRRHDFLSLDHLVHDVLGRVDEGVVGAGVALDGGAAGDVLYSGVGC